MNIDECMTSFIKIWQNSSGQSIWTDEKLEKEVLPVGIERYLRQINRPISGQPENFTLKAFAAYYYIRQLRKYNKELIDIIE